MPRRNLDARKLPDVREICEVFAAAPIEVHISRTVGVVDRDGAEEVTRTLGRVKKGLGPIDLTRDQFRVLAAVEATLPAEVNGSSRVRDEATRFYAIVAARPGRRRLVETRANGQPALAFYSRDATGDVFRATSLMVITLAGQQVTALTRFDPSVLRHFGLPRILPT